MRAVTLEGESSARGCHSGLVESLLLASHVRAARRLKSRHGFRQGWGMPWLWPRRFRSCLVFFVAVAAILHITVTSVTSVAFTSTRLYRQHMGSLGSSCPRRTPSVARRQQAQSIDMSFNCTATDAAVAEVVIDAAADESYADVSMYQRLSAREHVLLRPDTYIGSIVQTTRETWLLTADGNGLEQRPVTYAPGFLKIFDEILVNAMDQQFAIPRIRSRAKTTEISVEVDVEGGTISVSNDGVGIPIEKQLEYDAWVPSIIYGELLTGSNFDDESGPRFVGGRNGVGSKATNIFSTEFSVDIIDPSSKRRFQQTWTDNMANAAEPTIQEGIEKDQAKTARVKVQFAPDFARFGMDGLDETSVQLLRARVLDAAACTQPGIRVTFNGEDMHAQEFADYAKLAFGELSHTITQIKDDGIVRMQVAVGLSTEKGFRSIGFVNGIRCHSGTHVDSVVQQVVTNTVDALTQSSKNKDIKIQPQFVKEHLFVVVKAMVSNPSFESQSKEHLATPEDRMGFNSALPVTFLNKVRRLGLEQIVKDYATFKQNANYDKRMVSKGDVNVKLSKLEDAQFAGKAGHNCTLILTEGDSAKAMVLGALESIPESRAHYGVFPLKGKFLNVRTASASKLSQSAVVKELMHVLGLQLHEQFDTVAAPNLRYQRVMVFADQDHDGDHITGLIINFFATLWPSIFDVEPRFVIKFVTPLVKVQNHPGMEFYSTQEWEQWAAKDPLPKPVPKYYKGLGTSSDAEAMEYFKDLDRHTLALRWAGKSDDEVLKLAFDGTMAENRREWLLNTYDPDSYLDYSQDVAPHREFFDQSFIHYSMYDCQRSIPHLMDGLKISQRKAMTVALSHLKSDTKVTVFSNDVMSKMKYHHGDAAMTETIVRLAQTHLGTNNVNFLKPHGQFGSRLSDRSEHAQARYIGIDLEPITNKIFRPEDEAILDYTVDEMAEVEPPYLLPVIPTVLLNGASGIATGWSTDVANYNPSDVIFSMRRVVDGDDQPQLLQPWYDGFTGTIIEGKTEFHSVGTFQVGMTTKAKRTPDAIAITELPVGTWTDLYKEWLVTKSDLSTMIKKLDTSQNGKSTVDLILRCDPKKLRAFMEKYNTDEDIAKRLGLVKRIPSRMWLWNSTGKLEFFKDTDAVIRSFYKVRLPMYQKRLDHLLEKERREVERSRSRVEFIDCVVNGSLMLFPQPPASKMNEDLQKLGFEPLKRSDARGRPTGTASYNHVLEMTFSSLTEEKKDDLLRDLQSHEAKLRDLEIKGAEDLWRRDLDDLEDAYLEFKDQRETMGGGRSAERGLKRVVPTSFFREGGLLQSPVRDQWRLKKRSGRRWRARLRRVHVTDSGH